MCLWETTVPNQFRFIRGIFLLVGFLDGLEEVGFTVLGLLVVGFFVIIEGAHAPTVSESPGNGHHKLLVARLER
jgi:hypothetical protein